MKFYTPNSYANTLEGWRRDNRLKALGAAICRGGTIEGGELAALLGLSPRALRLLLVKDGYFTVCYDTGETLYTISPSTIKTIMPLPKAGE